MLVKRGVMSRFRRILKKVKHRANFKGREEGHDEERRLWSGAWEQYCVGLPTREEIHEVRPVADELVTNRWGVVVALRTKRGVIPMYAACLSLAVRDLKRRLELCPSGVEDELKEAKQRITELEQELGRMKFVAV